MTMMVGRNDFDNNADDDLMMMMMKKKKMMRMRMRMRTRTRTTTTTTTAYSLLKQEQLQLAQASFHNLRLRTGTCYGQDLFRSLIGRPVMKTSLSCNVRVSFSHASHVALSSAFTRNKAKSESAHMPNCTK